MNHPPITAVNRTPGKNEYYFWDGRRYVLYFVEYFTSVNKMCTNTLH